MPGPSRRRGTKAGAKLAFTYQGERLKENVGGMAGFTDMLKHYEARSPLKRNVLPDELGAAGIFLANDGAAAITGQVIHVDSGYQIMGM